MAEAEAEAETHQGEDVLVEMAPSKDVNMEEIAFDPFFDEVREAYGTDGTSSGVHTCSLEWKDLSFEVTTTHGCFRNKTMKTTSVLRGCSGNVQPTEVLAILGASGAGKTTLLNMLAGRMASSQAATTSGTILLNGSKRNYGQFKRLSAYVEQDDNMLAEMTVEEQIRFSANCRLPKTYSRAKKKSRVDQIIAELGLESVRHVKIGSPLIRGVSGGERKRVNIGTELVTEPSLIFLDEPTSGLDAFNALNAMKTLRNLAKSGRTVVTTIHQPRSNIFQLFDKLLLLASGQVMYFGSAKEATTYFTGLGFRCPSHFNPADYFIDLLSTDQRSPENLERSSKRIEYLAEMHVAHVTATEKNKTGPDSDEQMLEQKAGDQQEKHQSKFPTPYPLELLYLCERQFKAMTRERAGNIARAMQTIFFALLLGLIWLNVGRAIFDKDNLTACPLQDYNAAVGVIFFICINQTFGGVFSIIFVYPMERAVVLRERASGSYRVSSYLMCKTLVELPRTVIFVTVFITITYWMIGLRPTFWAYFLTLAAISLTSMCAESLTIALSTVAPTPQVTAAIAPVFVILSVLMAGFFIPEDLLPVWLGWLQYLSFIKYTFSAVIQIQFDNTACESQVLQFANVSIGLCFVMLFVLWAGFRMVAYTFLRLKGPKFNKKM